MRVWLLPSLWVGLAWGCSGSSEYTCPDPVGKIIRDDCEVYRTKYESLKVELSASVGPAELKTSLGQQSLRDPGELLQVLGHRTHALCRDFNACRVPPLEYRTRREQADRMFTAISAIQEQLKGTLEAEPKARLVQELVRLLSEDQQSVSVPGAPRAASSGRAFAAASGAGLEPYRSSVPWYGTKLLPPQPGSPDGFPRLAGSDFSLEHVFRGHSPYGVIGYRPRARLYFRGAAEPDDAVQIDWGGARSECPLARGTVNGLAHVSCKAPKELVLTGPSFTVQVSYRRGSDGKTARLGAQTAAVLSREEEDTRNGSHRYGIDHDDSARRALLVFRPHSRALPAELEQPSLVVTLKLRKYLPATARCWANGQAVTAGLSASRCSGQEGSFQDRPRYERTGPGSSRAVAEPFIEWRRYDFPLPFVVSRGSQPPPEGMKPWPVAGGWRCVVSVEGEPVRELLFSVSGDGTLRAHPRQRERSRPGWLLETRVLPNPVEVPVP